MTVLCIILHVFSREKQCRERVKELRKEAIQLKRKKEEDLQVCIIIKYFT